MNNFYILATPIGNVNEISKRAIEILKEVNVVFCEDTRISKKLFNILLISIENKKFIKCDSFNESKIKQILFNHLKENDCVLLSDSGYPTISDPGFLIKKFLYEQNIFPIVINGPCSIIHALAASNVKTNNFYFHGFLNKKKEKRIKELYLIKNIHSTIIIFESVHNIINTLNNIKEVMGDIFINVCKELTKINEKIYFDRISVLIKTINVKGEFIIVFENEDTKELDQNKLILEITNLVNKKFKLKDACKMVSYKYNLKTNSLYELYNSKKDESWNN